MLNSMYGSFGEASMQWGRLAISEFAGHFGVTQWGNNESIVAEKTMGCVVRGNDGDDVYYLAQSPPVSALAKEKDMRSCEVLQRVHQ